MGRGIADTRFTLGEIIASGWDLYWKHFRSILLIYLAVYVPINTGLSFLPVSDWIETYGLHGLGIYARLILWSESLLGVLATMSLAKLIEASFYGQTVTWPQALRHALSRWAVCLLTGLLAGLIISLLTLLLIVPGIIWSVYYIFFVYVVALRGLWGKRALDYSRAVVKGQWWRVFGYLLALVLLNLLVVSAVAIPFGFTPENRILDILADTVSDIVSALFLLMILVFFLNSDYLKMRREPVGAPEATFPGAASTPVTGEEQRHSF